MRRAGLLLVGLMLSTGCPKLTYPECKKDKHCAQEGGTCVDGLCQNCVTNEDCADRGPQFVCHEFRCTDELPEPEPPTTDNPPCTGAEDCFGGLVCREGECVPCEHDDECTTGECNVATGRCPEPICTSDDQCPMDEICDGGVCIYPNPGEAGGPCGLDALYFGFDSDKLTPTATEKLATFAQCVIEQGRTVRLEAHADNVGTEEYNIMLTDRRGQSVYRYLVTLGVPEDLLQVVAKGALEASGVQESERAKDRRVDFIFE